MFHSIKGKNIKLERDKTTAEWSPTETGGHILTSQSLDPQQKLTLILDGTGGVELGVINQDPKKIGGRWPCLESYQFLNDVKIHKRSCTIEISIDYKKLQVTSTYGKGVYTQKLRSEKKYWLTVDVKYGEVEIKIQNREGSSVKYSFHKQGGKNIKVLNPTIARSLSKSPAALCIYQSPLQPGKALQLHTAPKPYQGTTPGRYYVKLFLTDTNPRELQDAHPDKFDISRDITPNPRWTNIETFEKEDCHGVITLEFKEKSLKYQAASGKKSVQDYNTQHGRDVWLVLELYGVTVGLNELPPHVRSRQASSGSQDSCPVEGRDEPDAAYLTPHGNTFGFVAVESNNNPDIDPSYCCLERTGPSADDQTYWNNKNSGLRLSSEIEIQMSEGIRKNFTSLLRQLTGCDHIADLMFQEKYITYQQREEIEKADNKVRYILMMMIRKPMKKHLLDQLLDETEQAFLLPKFLNDVPKG